MLELYFIRHAQSTNNVVLDELEREDYLFHRVVDPSLTDLGHEQAKLVAEFVARNRSDGDDPQNRKGFGLTHLYCSLMTRAVQTGTAISKASGLPLKAWPEVHETGGEFRAEKRDGETALIGLPGKGRSFFKENYPELILPEDLTDEGWWNREKEPRENYSPRARQILERLMAEHGGSNDRVGIVMHGAIFARILSVLYDIRAEHFWFLMNNTGISRIDIRDDGHVMLSYLNKVDHLPDHLIT